MHLCLPLSPASHTRRSTSSWCLPRIGARCASWPPGRTVSVSATWTGRHEQIEEYLQPLLESGEAQGVYTTVGNWDPNRSFLSIPLADWGDRERSQQEIADELRGKLSGIPGARVGIWGGNSLNLRTWGSGLRVALLGNDYDEIFEAAKAYAAGN